MEFVEQLKSSIDIVEVVGQHVRLRKSGQRHVGLCPFHTEKTPSFGVHSVHQFYKCFGCGAGGDVIKFVMEIESLTFWEAVKLLAETHGVPMPKRAEYSDPETKLRGAIYRMHEIARDLYRSVMNSETRAYLSKRGVGQDLVETFELGYAEPSGQLLTRRFEREGFTAEQMEASGLVIKREDAPGFYDRFRSRLMFPIHSDRGQVIAFGGRALSGQDPKYLNSSETPVYSKSRVLYNLNRAKETIKKQDRAVLVEGYMDVIGAWAADVRCVVASCGTALASPQVRALRRFTDKIVVNFDPDAAGMQAAERSIQMLLEEQMRVRVVELEGGLDPDEYVKAHGAEAYRAHIDKAPGYFYWLADRARARFDMQTADGRIAGLQFLLPAIQRMSDKLERAAVAEEIATYLRIERGLVLDSFRRAAAERREKTIQAGREPVRPLEKILLNAVLSDEQVRREILPRLQPMPAVRQFATRKIFDAVFGLAASGNVIRYGEVEARLDDTGKELLAAAVLADKEGEDQNLLQEALACVRALEQADHESRRSALKARIREAERAGMLEEALRMTEELGKLDRS